MKRASRKKMRGKKKERSRLYDISALAANVDVVNGCGGGNTCRPLFDLEDVGAVLESATELRGVDCKAEASVDIGIHNGVLKDA